MSKARLFSVAAAVVALVFATGLSAAAGDLDTTFDGDGKVLTDFAGGSNDLAFGVAVQADGKVVVAGETVVGNDPSFAVVRYTVNGALDPAFDGDGKCSPRASGQVCSSRVPPKSILSSARVDADDPLQLLVIASLTTEPRGPGPTWPGPRPARERIAASATRRQRPRFR
jgi:hypothetical protein